MGGTVRSQERMRLLLILLPRLSLSTCQAFAPGDNCDEWKVGNLWQVGYDASLVFTVDHKVTSWTIHLEFESPLEGLDCYIAKASSSDNVHWDISSFDWDGPQDVGDQLEIGFQVHFSGDPPDLIYADFDGPDHPICGSSGPTDPPTTEPTTPGTTPTTETSTEPATTSSTTTTTASTTGPAIECPDGWVASVLTVATVSSSLRPSQATGQRVILPARQLGVSWQSPRPSSWPNNWQAWLCRERCQ